MRLLQLNLKKDQQLSKLKQQSDLVHRIKQELMVFMGHLWVKMKRKLTFENYGLDPEKRFNVSEGYTKFSKILC